MNADWLGIRLEFMGFDEAMRERLREAQPMVVAALPAILERFYEKVRKHEPASPLFQGGLVQQAIRSQVRQWELITSGNFGEDYIKSLQEFCDLHARIDVPTHWYMGCRQMFLTGELLVAVDRAMPMPRFGKAAEAAQRKKALIMGDVSKAMMLDSGNLMMVYGGGQSKVRKEKLTAAQERFQTIISSLTSASSEFEGTARALSANADDTTRLASVVANASEDASRNVQSVASATEELATSVRGISEQVQQSTRIAGSAVEQAHETDSRINALSQAASRIGDVVKLITSVAEQTNLLALNATIEAARAGEAGRGFAVVAQEVKALAAQTAKATDEIGAQIASMQTATQEAVSSIQAIGATIGKISEIASAISVAVEEQGAATQEISSNIQRAAAGTSQVAGTIAEVSQGANQTGAASTQLLSSAKQMAESTNSLQSEIKDFVNLLAQVA